MIIHLSLRGRFIELKADIAASSQNIADSTSTSHSHHILCSLNINIIASCRHHRLKADAVLAMIKYLYSSLSKERHPMNKISPKHFGLTYLYAILHLTLCPRHPTINPFNSIIRNITNRVSTWQSKRKLYGASFYLFL